MMRSQSS